MRNVWIWVGLAAGAVAILLLLAVAFVQGYVAWRMGRTYPVEVAAVAVPQSPEEIAEGERLYVTRGCADCHGGNGAGVTVIDAFPVGTMAGANLTGGKGSETGNWTSADYVRAIRHGLDEEGKPLVFMPSYEYAPYFSDVELGRLIAYIQSLPPVDNEPLATVPGPLMRVLYLAGELPLLSVEVIDHNAPPPPHLEPAPTAEYGARMALGCTGCHGPGLSGGQVPGTPPDFPPALNLTPDPQTGLAGWSADNFNRAIRFGETPDGRKLNPFMPWPNFARLTDVEVQALWAYLQTIPAKPEGNR